MHSSNPINPFFFPFIPHKEDLDSFFHQHVHEYLLHHQQQPPPAAAAGNPQPPSKDEDQDQQSVRSNPTKKSKKDRHSKITTAKGPRDRRMRLSIDIARRFFDLQDLLGFDKASSTVEWLLTKSGEAIRELSNNGSAGFVDPIGSANSTTSECEVASTKSSGNVAKERKSSANLPRKSAYNLTMTKESRKAARERAKERTLEKIRISFFDHDQVIRPMMSNIGATSPNNHHHLELQIPQDPSSSDSIIFNYEYDDHHQNLE